MIIEIEKFLSSQGYKQINKPDWDPAIAVWQKENRDLDIPHCKCNEKQPSINISYHYFKYQDITHESFEMELIAESRVWWDFKAYGVSYEELQENIEEIEMNLINAWKAVCKELE